MKTETITFDELLAEFDRLGEVAGQGFATSRELQEQWGRSQKAVARVLHAAKAAGRLETQMVRRTDLAGRPQMSPGYRIKPAALPKRRGR